ncbi:ribosomal RNA small subunit methyltransferase A [Campylobacterota bacterium]|nr:ribosomal RNA small subunit methyltransferase A [Campylobacterota bacterium]
MPDTPQIVEVGPGLGDLTAVILEKCRVTAIEIDRDLIAQLQVRFASDLARGRLRLICADVLEMWGESLLDRTYAIVANLPYYAATEVVLRALADPFCESLVVMLQLEVARKLAGLDGRNSLSLLIESVGCAELLFEVPPTAFTPVPKVTSAVVRIIKRRAAYDRAFSEFLKMAFRQPRKRLQKNIEAPKELFDELKIGENARAHELTLADYEKLYKGIENGRNTGAADRKKRRERRE